MARKKMVKPEEMAPIESAEDRLAISLTKAGTKSAVKIRDQMMTDYLKDCLGCEVKTEDGEKKPVMQMLTESWVGTMLKNGVTSKDMLAIMKLRGEDVQKSQSVNVKINAEAKTGKTTDDFLSVISKPKAPKKKDEDGED